MNERRRHIGGHLRVARELVDLVPDGTEVLVPDAAHYPDLEHPDASTPHAPTWR